MNLICLHGFPGVGKFTVAKELSALTGYPLFHNHMALNLAAKVFRGQFEIFTDVRNQIWELVIERAAREQMPGLIFTVAFEKTVTDQCILNITESVERNGGRVCFTELVCDREEHKKRFIEPERKELGKGCDPEKFDQWWAEGLFYSGNIPRPHEVFDTTGKEAGEVAQLIFGRFKLSKVNLKKDWTPEPPGGKLK